MAVLLGDSGQVGGIRHLVSVTLGHRNLCVNENGNSHAVLVPH